MLQKKQRLQTSKQQSPFFVSEDIVSTHQLATFGCQSEHQIA